MEHLLSDDDYNRVFTIHGVVMVWFFLIPSIPATLGNFLLPLMLGARDLEPTVEKLETPIPDGCRAARISVSVASMPESTYTAKTA